MTRLDDIIDRHRDLPAPRPSGRAPLAGPGREAPGAFLPGLPEPSPCFEESMNVFMRAMIADLCKSIDARMLQRTVKVFHGGTPPTTTSIYLDEPIP